MTVQLMSILTRRQISDLNKAAKSELRSFIANKLQPITGRAELIVTRNDDTSPDLATLIVEDAKAFMKEIDELLATPNHDGHLGAGSEKHQQ